MEKEQLINNVKEWIKMDSDILQLKTQIKDLNNKKKLLTSNLLNIMKTNKIDCFDINDNALIYKQNKIKKPLNKKSLLSALQKYYKTDAKIAEELTKHIMDSREEDIKETIKQRKK
jgi:hypothetical protein